MKRASQDVGALQISAYRDHHRLCDYECRITVTGGRRRAATRRVTLAGYPAGFLCEHCAVAWIDIWRGITAPADEMEAA